MSVRLYLNFGQSYLRSVEVFHIMSCQTLQDLARRCPLIINICEHTLKTLLFIKEPVLRRHYVGSFQVTCS